jgi:diaminohydroxyphosphoribosylaminopyrimidine deaminase / 5-amino-6-(5-phosphoribosylamino)uracil reductase
MKKRPFVTLKLAQTLDGCIATASGDSKWITSETSRVKTHQLRAGNDAILVGSNTVRADDPQLSVRHIMGKSPTKIVLDARLDLPTGLKIFSGAPLILVAAKGVGEDRVQERENRGAVVWQVDASETGRLDLSQVMEKAMSAGFDTVLIEGGSRVAASAFLAGIVDKMVVFIAPKILGAGLPSVGSMGLERIAESIQLLDVEVDQSGDDLMVTASIQKGPSSAHTP